MAPQGNVGHALQDVWWAVLNRNEFILDSLRVRDRDNLATEDTESTEKRSSEI